MLEVIATVIPRCFDKNTLKELYLVNFLDLKEPDVGLWKNMEGDWAFALRPALPNHQEEYTQLQQTSCFLKTTADRQASRALTSLEIYNGTI